MGSELPALPTLAARVSWLFDSAPERLKRKITKRGAAREITARGYPISHSTLFDIMRGRKTNPTMAMLTGIAELFDVPVGWLVGDNAGEALAENDPAQRALRAALAEEKIQHIAMRSAGLSPMSLDAIAQIIQAARIAEGLDESGQNGP